MSEQEPIGWELTLVSGEREWNYCGMWPDFDTALMAAVHSSNKRGVRLTEVRHEGATIVRPALLAALENQPPETELLREPAGSPEDAAQEAVEPMPNASQLCPETATEVEILWTLRVLTAMAHENSKSKGFHEGQQSPWSMLGNIHCEVSEAWEVLRDGHDPQHVWRRAKDGKPEGLVYELADVLIRVLDTSAALNLDIGIAVIEKMRFNRTRPSRHGGKVI